MIITEMGVMELQKRAFYLKELNPEYTIEQIQEATEELIISPDLCDMK